MIKEKEFKQLVLHYYRLAFEQVGVARKHLQELNKADDYSKNEWNKLSNATGIEETKLRHWRSEYEPLKNAFKTLLNFAAIAQINNLAQFINVFFRKNTEELDNNSNASPKNWASRLLADTDFLNNEAIDQRILLSDFITFFCRFPSSEIREEIIGILRLISTKLSTGKKEDSDKIIDVLKLIKRIAK